MVGSVSADSAGRGWEPGKSPSGGTAWALRSERGGRRGDVGGWGLSSEGGFAGFRPARDAGRPPAALSTALAAVTHRRWFMLRDMV